ncbi:MAG TPA: hypothetical protein VGF77_08525 [Allosphingosinicella sp.]|jgi:hypothetical protein
MSVTVNRRAVSMSGRGLRGESYADQARRLGSVAGVTITPDMTDQEVMDAVGNGIAADAELASNEAVAAAALATTALTNIEAALAVMDLIIYFGQSLTLSRSPQVTLAANIVPDAYTFNGGPEAFNFNQPTSGNSISWPIPPANMTSMVPLVPLVGVESLAAGACYQSHIAGRPSFFCSFGIGAQSARQLREGNLYFENLKYGVQCAVKLIRAAGYRPNPIIIWAHGNADADQADDGNIYDNTETSSADYQTATKGKIFPSICRAVSFALGQVWTGPIWVEPLLTGAGDHSGTPQQTITGRRNINAAQVAMQSAQIRLLPSWSQFVAHAAVDLTHPDGQGYRYRGELHSAYARQDLVPPKMLSKAVSGATVVVTFDQPVRISTRIPAGSGLTGVYGFEIYDNTGASVPITSVVPSGSNPAQIIITPATVANLTGPWVVRNGQQQGPDTGTAATYFPRTFVVGEVDVGIAEDGTVMENASISQEN